jgi:hypothetical protein
MESNGLNIIIPPQVFKGSEVKNASVDMRRIDQQSRSKERSEIFLFIFRVSSYHN